MCTQWNTVLIIVAKCCRLKLLRQNNLFASAAFVVIELKVDKGEGTDNLQIVANHDQGVKQLSLPLLLFS